LEAIQFSKTISLYATFFLRKKWAFSCMQIKRGI